MQTETRQVNEDAEVDGIPVETASNERDGVYLFRDNNLHVTGFYFVTASDSELATLRAWATWGYDLKFIGILSDLEARVRLTGYLDETGYSDKERVK